MPIAVALSPHLDDAAFSCGGTLATLAQTGWRVVVATVFTASVPDPQGFALACQVDKGLGPEIDYMALRRAEDFGAANALGVEARHLPFREAPHRGYASAAALFAGVRDEDGIAGDLRPILAALLQAFAPDLVLAPQAIGNHADHVALVRALHALGPAAPVLWWRDFPYVARTKTPAEPFGAAMAPLPEYEVRLGPEAVKAKRLACQAYASQIGFQFGGAAGLDARLAEAGASETFRCSGTLQIRGLVQSALRPARASSRPARNTARSSVTKST